MKNSTIEKMVEAVATALIIATMVFCIMAFGSRAYAGDNELTRMQNFNMKCDASDAIYRLYDATFDRINGSDLLPADIKNMYLKSVNDGHTKVGGFIDDLYTEVDIDIQYCRDNEYIMRDVVSGEYAHYITMFTNFCEGTLSDVESYEQEELEERKQQEERAAKIVAEHGRFATMDEIHSFHEELLAAWAIEMESAAELIVELDLNESLSGYAALVLVGSEMSVNGEVNKARDLCEKSLKNKTSQGTYKKVRQLYLDLNTAVIQAGEELRNTLRGLKG